MSISITQINGTTSTATRSATEPGAGSGGTTSSDMNALIVNLMKIMQEQKKDAIKGIGDGKDQAKLLEGKLKMGDAEAAQGVINSMAKGETESKKAIASR